MRCSGRRSIFPFPSRTGLTRRSGGSNRKASVSRCGWCARGIRVPPLLWRQCRRRGREPRPVLRGVSDRSLFLVNYRGYGGSSGQPAEAALFADALAVFDHVRREHSEIAVMGRSLGSGVAVFVASARPVERLVLVTAFDSLVNVAKEYFRWLPLGLLLRDRYESVSRAGEVKTPVLMVIAGEDEIIPRARSEALAKAFPAARSESRSSRGSGTTRWTCRPRISRRYGGSWRRRWLRGDRERTLMRLRCPGGESSGTRHSS